MPTVADVAKAAGVSTATVSRVLSGSAKVSEQTQQLVMKAVEATGYALSTRARNSSQLSQMVAVIAPLHIPELETAIAEEAMAQNLGAVFLLNRMVSDINGYLGGLLRLMSKQLLGVITVDDIFWNSGLASDLLDVYPVVHVLGEMTAAKGCSVGCDDMQIGYDATAHLLSLGCRRIAAVSTTNNRVAAQNRVRGYQLALLDHRIIPAFSQDIRISMEDDTEKSRVMQMAELLAAAGELDALFCVNDAFAADAILALRQLNRRVPEDVMVMGVDNSADATRSQPQISTVMQDFRTIGNEAVRMLVDLAAGRITGDRRTLVPHRLLLRQSTGENIGL